MKKILFLPTYGIGDILLATPVIRNIKENVKAKLTCLHMFKANQEILENNPYVDENIYFDFFNRKTDVLKFIFGLRRTFDCSINLYPSNRKEYNILSFLFASALRIGHHYRLDDVRELNFLKNKTTLEDDGLHCVEENLKLLQFLGIARPQPYNLEIYLTEKEKEFAAAWLENNGLSRNLIIGLHPGTSAFKNHLKRRWPAVKFAQLIDTLAQSYPGSVFLLFGGEEENELKNSIERLVKVKKRVFIFSSQSIRQSAALMRYCKIFLSNDSGLMHLAVALGVKTVALFGPTNHVWVRPWKVEHRVVRLGLACSPCFRYSPRPLRCPAGSGYACIENITIENVFMAAVELLEK